MKPPGLDSVTVAMAAKCSSGVTMTTDMVHTRSRRSHRSVPAYHRKSAVELLEASKGTYVKSTTVLNHKQELKHPENLSVGNGEVLSRPITAGKHSPLEDSPTSVTKDRIRARSKSREAKNQNSSGEVKSNNLSRETTDFNITVERNTDNLKQTSSESGSPLSLKKSSVTSTISSTSSQATKSPSVPKNPSVPAQTSDSKSKPAVPPRTESSTNLVKKLSISSSVTSSVSLASAQSHSKDEVDSSNFKTPLTPPPKLGPKPVVPPKPGSATKPTTPPKPGPKPVLQHATEKPVPPPRSARKENNCQSTLSESNGDNTVTMASNDEHSVSDQAPSTPDQKRFSSVSASACEVSSKERLDKPVRSRESRQSLNSQNEVFLKPLRASALSASVGVLVERQRSPLPKPRIDKKVNEIDLPPRRQLHRSQSDLSNCRHSRTSSDFSDLSSRLSRTSTEVERFFNQMGIDREVLEPMRKLCETKNKELLDNLSSLGSLEGHSLSSQLSYELDRLPMESEQDLSERDPGTTSVVERNARIIKWLCNVKKARTVQTRPVKKKSEAS